MSARELRSRLCAALIDGWSADKNMAYVLDGIVKDGNPDEIAACRVVLRVGNIHFRQPARAFIAANYPVVSDALWSRRPECACLDLLRRTLGGRVRERGVFVGARASDKRHDWKTVK